MGYGLGRSPLFVWGGIWGGNEGQIVLNLPPTCNRIVLLLKIERFDMSIKKEMEKLIQATPKKGYYRDYYWK